MIYYQEQAHEQLRKVVRCYWKLENNTSEALQYTIFPDGFYDLLICFHEDCLEAILLSGLWTKKAAATIAPGSKIVGIQFRLLAIETIIQESIAPILNNLKELEKTHWGLDSFAKFKEEALFEYFNKHLLSIVGQQEIDPRKYDLLTLVNQSKGNQTVDSYSKQVFWSKRQINRYFQAQFGLSLKSYCTIRKCSSSFSQIKKGQLNPTQNYFDQSHFIKEVKKITGNTPKNLTKNKNDRFLQFSIIKNT